MSFVPGDVPVTAAGSIANQPLVANIVIVAAATEYSQALGTTKGFRIYARTGSTLRIGFTAGATTTSYITLPMGAEYTSPPMLGVITLYVQSTLAGEVVEVEYWT
jgi:hypothetical protein